MNNTIKIKKSSIQRPRSNWSIAFKKMHDDNEDDLLIQDVFEDENIDETIVILEMFA